ncbi:MAG TPA: FAD-dependent monooxygenase [Phycisphaerae bacterium]|jgi:2-polyprenyl-6-methoxyphenol hydroxylase-like FAD-dependent oxidoreductase
MSAFDVIIVGAGPVGATAANLLARAGKSVALLDACAFPRPALCAGWLNARVLLVLKQLQVSVERLGAQIFDTATFYTADLVRSVHPRFKSAPGFVVDRALMDQMLVRAAAGAGATVLEQHRVIDIIPREREVEVMIADRPALRARTAIIACGRNVPTLSRLGIGRPSEPPRLWSALRHWSAPVAASGDPPSPVASDPRDARARKRRTGRRDKIPIRVAPNPAAKSSGAPVLSDASISVILGLTRSGGFGVLTQSAQGINLAAHAHESPQELTAELENLCARLTEKKMLPAAADSCSCPNLPPNDAFACEPVLSPAGSALDMETHVGKHTLVIGDAGGFACAASNEGLYPGMWSAQIAAEVVAQALTAPNSQDVLMRFESRWRSEMGEYLRMPNTDIQFLMPLIFSNQSMADRMGAAFFCGQNI